jgi:hypothetical protein
MMQYPNRLEETEIYEDGNTHFVFDVTIGHWYLCVEGEWETPPEHWFLSGASHTDRDPISNLLSSILDDQIESAYNYDDYEIGTEIAELVLEAPVHEWRDMT